jgi:hypothetical protein
MSLGVINHGMSLSVLYIDSIELYWFNFCVCNFQQINKFYLMSVHFITVQHKLSRAFQTDMHNKLHKLNTAQ